VESARLGEGPAGLCLPESPGKLGAKVAWPRVLVDGGHGMVFGVLELSTANEVERTSTQLTVKKMRGRKFDNRPVKVRIHPGKGIIFQVPQSHKQRRSSTN